MKWYVYSLRKYAVFKGRASRREHWTFELTNSVITLALFVAVVMVARVGYQYFVSLPFLYIAAMTVPSLASLVRRLHDTNRSGWWFFVSLVPVVGPLILFSMTVTRSDPDKIDLARIPISSRRRRRQLAQKWDTWHRRSTSGIFGSDFSD